MICTSCGYNYDVPAPVKGENPNIPPCPLCEKGWDVWELRMAAIPLIRNREQIASWLGQLPYPASIDIVATSKGLRVRMYTPPDKADGAVAAWASMNHHQTRWEHIGIEKDLDVTIGTQAGETRKDANEILSVLKTNAKIASLALSEIGGDPILAIGGQLLNGLVVGEQRGLRIWIVGKDADLQARLRALSAYSYGTESGVGTDTPNPWGIRLALLRLTLFAGLMIAAVSGGFFAVGWLSPIMGLIGVIAGGILVVVAALGMQDWMQWRSIPKSVYETSINDMLLKTTFVLHGVRPERQSLTFVAGESHWKPLHNREWPGIQAETMTIGAGELAALIAPPEIGEGSGMFDRDVIQDIPAPPPSQPLLDASFKVGSAVNTFQRVGIDPDGHGMATGGSRTGKTSFGSALLEQLVAQGDAAPGIFLVDPHLSLSDGFLQMVNDLPRGARKKAIQRLIVITPDNPELIPLNLLALPDFSWAGNAIVQIGRRLWDEYWGPRMQAALLGLFRLAHAWNMGHPGESMGLLHTVFAAYNQRWRREAVAYLQPVERVGSLALDALLGQFEREGGNPMWVTEVVSPVLSKVMGLELSPWLFASMHQKSFVDMEKWVQNRAWVVLRLPSGTMGRESARMTASVIYNVFDAAFRKITLDKPIPFYFIIDEAQEIASGMRLEAMLSEGAKFGARMFVLVQSLSMMRRVEGFEAVVQALLANTSTQAFFSPDPEDADTIRAALSSTVRYGDMTLDLPTLNCWLRARVGAKWQPPTLIKVEPLKRGKSKDVQKVIREVIAAHPNDYVLDNGLWQLNVVDALKKMIPKNLHYLVDLAYNPEAARIRREAYDKKNEEEKAEAEKVQKEGQAAENATRGTLVGWS